MSLDLIILACIVVFFVMTLIQNNPMQHDIAYRRRRFINWFLLGLTYAFLYMGRYNLTVAKMALGNQMPNDAFGMIFGVGAWVYALSFLFNGPLTDKLGGRFAILLSSFGSAFVNALMGIFLYFVLAKNCQIPLIESFVVLYGLNMYFQSLGALSIIKVNAYWFHVKERGVVGGLFGILISLGLYFAFDWGKLIAQATMAQPANLNGVQEFIRSILVGSATASVNQTWWVFLVPSFILFGFFLLNLLVVRNKPSQVGFTDFDTADASSGDIDKPVSIATIMRQVITNPVIVVICVIELCSGILRNGIMHWYPIYMGEVNKNLAALGATKVTFFLDHWGLLLMLAGVLGGVLAGFISDKVFGSRRGPVATLLYGGMLITTIGLACSIQSYYWLGIFAVLGSLCVIGVHGMLSGTATMDFGGRKGAATAVGIVDGAAYAGTGLQALAIGYITTEMSWAWWPIFLIPFSLLGLILALQIWRAFPQAKGKGGH